MVLKQELELNGSRDDSQGPASHGNTDQYAHSNSSLGTSNVSRQYPFIDWNSTALNLSVKSDYITSSDSAAHHDDNMVNGQKENGSGKARGGGRYLYSKYLYRDSHVYVDAKDGKDYNATLVNSIEAVRTGQPAKDVPSKSKKRPFGTLSDHSGASHEKGVNVIVEPYEETYVFQLDRQIPKTGLMMIGWGGNNGSTLTGALIAHKKNITWESRRGLKKPNYFGSVVMASTFALNEFVHVPVKSMLPILDPTDLVLGGWDISAADLGEAMDRATVLEPDLKRQIRAEMKKLKPLPSVYDPDFIALNQKDRANNVIPGNKKEQLEVIRKNITDFKASNQLDKVVVIWTANTERFAEVLKGVNDTPDNLLKSIEKGHTEIAPSTLFAVASILEGCSFINGSPQNTFVPGVIQLALNHGIHIGGDDFKSGQTKVKSVLVDFLVGAGIKPVAITSYNHLGNNDGKNLSAPSQFRSKEISKSNVVDDMVSSNSILYSENEKPDHVVVIKYTPAVGDSKRALDEYESDIFMGGRNTVSIHNTCEDSLLASPLILDLALLTELMTRTKVMGPLPRILSSLSVEQLVPLSPDTHFSAKSGKGLVTTDMFRPMHPILTLLSYLLKAPLVPEGQPIVNALFKQRRSLENFFRALIGLPPSTEMYLESRLAPPIDLNKIIAARQG